MTGPRVVAALLAALGAAVVFATIAYPPGSMGVPGPALVPRVLGVALVVVALLIVRTPGAAGPPVVRHRAAVPITMGLPGVYALLWRLAPHGALTGLVLLAFLRLTGVRWRGAVVAAAALATTLQLLFERGLGVRFH